MSNFIFGSKIDIQSGGMDLIFPHHENSMALSEAYNFDGIKNFLHVGHLSIHMKMNKYLRNIIFIKSVLQIVTARVLRLYFLHFRYDEMINCNPSISFKLPEEKDKRICSFFGEIRAALR